MSVFLASDALRDASDAMAANADDGGRSYLSSFRRRLSSEASARVRAAAAREKPPAPPSLQQLPPAPPPRPPPPPPPWRSWAPQPPPGRAADIDWDSRRTASASSLARIIDAIAGPGATQWELLLTACGLLGALGVACATALPLDEATTISSSWDLPSCLMLGWSRDVGAATPSNGRLKWRKGQYACSLALASFLGARAVQACSGQSKRHLHGPSGRLSGAMASLIAAEGIVHICLVSAVFTPSAMEAKICAMRASLWLALASLALHSVPVHAQRPLSTLLLLASLALDRVAELLPPTPGMEWARILLPVTYLIGLPVRAEPYIDRYPR